MSPEIEKYRKPHPMDFPHKTGDDFGWFEIPGPSHKDLFVMASFSEDEWHHVSVSTSSRCPTWKEMCFIKELFFGDVIVVQFHPLKKGYVNMAKNCLHLWKWNGGEFPTPPPILVGLKGVE